MKSAQSNTNPAVNVGRNKKHQQVKKANEPLPMPEPRATAKTVAPTVEIAPEPVIEKVDLDKLAARMCDVIVAGAINAHIVLLGKQIQGVDDNCFRILDSTSPEVVTEDWAMALADQLAKSYVTLDGSDPSNVADSDLAKQINGRVTEVLTHKYATNDLIHRYTVDELKDIIIKNAADKFSIAIPEDKIEEIGAVPTEIPESALCELVVDLVMVGVDAMQELMREQFNALAEEMVESASSTKAVHEEAPAAAAPEPEVVEPKPTMKAKVSAGEGHDRVDVEVEVEGDFTNGGEIHITLPPEPLRVIALRDSSLVDKEFDETVLAKMKAVLNRAILKNEVITQETKDRLVNEAFGIRKRGGYEQAEYRVGSISFDFDLTSVTIDHIRKCHNGVTYADWMTHKQFDKLSKGHKTISIVEDWWRNLVAA